MPELGTSGSVRGVRSNAHPYRHKAAPVTIQPLANSFTILKRAVTTLHSDRCSTWITG
jgi:hypothetical protein